MIQKKPNNCFNLIYKQTKRKKLKMGNTSTEKKAYLMINAYGKIEAEKVAVGYANDWIKEINELKHYDGEKIKRMDDRKWYWLTVASAIKNWV